MTLQWPQNGKQGAGCASLISGIIRSNRILETSRKELLMMELLMDPQAWLALATLTALELVLGIDNIIFISILVERLPKAQQKLARRVGLAMAMFMRLGLLLLLAWIVGLTQPLFTILSQEVSGRDLILIGGGLFLLWKSTKEIHFLLEGGHDENVNAVKATFASVIIQIAIVDMVFSLDSIITAVGMVDEIQVMMAAVVLSVGLMMLFAEPIGRIVSTHPTIKVLALGFLIVVGVVLIVDGFDYHIPKGYVYFAMFFSVMVEVINLRMRKKTVPTAPVQLHQHFEEDDADGARPWKHASVVLYVKDLPRALAFYRDVLSVRVHRERDDHAVLDCGNMNLVLHRMPSHMAQAATLESPPRRRESSAHKLSFRVDSIARARETAVQRGGLLDPGPPAWVVDEQKICVGHDPEGNVIQLYEE
jgi:predicted tellurium resistance membrane protein TerC/catechol 2,3-dioxygenase-like lactoylglutathione lyase family enzyme